MISLAKWKSSNTLQKCVRFGQNNSCLRLWKVAQNAINHPIWSHWKPYNAFSDELPFGNNFATFNPTSGHTGYNGERDQLAMSTSVWPDAET